MGELERFFHFRFLPRIVTEPLLSHMVEVGLNTVLSDRPKTFHWSTLFLILLPARNLQISLVKLSKSIGRLYLTGTVTTKINKKCLPNLVFGVLILVLKQLLLLRVKKMLLSLKRWVFLRKRNCLQDKIFFMIIIPVLSR